MKKHKTIISLPFFATLLLMFSTGMAFGDGGLTTVGYFSASALQGGIGTKGGPIKPKDQEDVFLGVVISLPQHLLVPTEAEYGKMKRSQNSDKELPPRTQIKSYTPSRFSLILPDGTAFAGVVISLWPADEIGFSTGMRTTGSLGSRVEKIAVAFVIPKADSNPPFCVQIGRKEPVPVAENKLVPPSSSPF